MGANGNEPVKIGRYGAEEPFFRDQITGKREEDSGVISEIEKSESEYQNMKFAGIAVKELRDLKVSEFLTNRLVSPDSRKIHWLEYAFSLMGDINGKEVCDFGCGHGEMSVYLAKAGAKVKAFDISREGVAAAKKMAIANGVAERVETELRSAHSTGYPSDSFDVVFVAGVLHHLCLQYALPEIKRILKPGGRFVFLEPVILSRFMEFVKWKTPLRRFLTLKTASKFEKSLEAEDIRYIKEVFEKNNMDRFRFFARFESKCSNDDRKIYKLYYADYLLFKIAPFMKSFSSAIVGYGDK